MITIIDMFVYSSNMKYSNLNELTDNNYIKQIKPRDLLPFDGTKIYLSTSSIEYNNIISNEGNITFMKRPSRATMYPEENSVWFAKMKNTIKVYFSNKESSKKYIMSNGFYGFKSLNEETLPTLWLKYIFLSSKFNKFKDGVCEGSSMSALKDDLLNKIVVPIYEKEHKDVLDLISKLELELIYQTKMLEEYSLLKMNMLNLLFE